MYFIARGPGGFEGGKRIVGGLYLGFGKVSDDAGFAGVGQSYQDDLAGTVFVDFVQGGECFAAFFISLLEFLFVLRKALSMVRPKVVGALVLGHDPHHFFEGFDFFFWRNGFSIALFGPTVVGRQVGWHG